MEKEQKNHCTAEIAAFVDPKLSQREREEEPSHKLSLESATNP